MLRVVVAAPPEVRVPEDLARLPAAADLIELRLDLLGLAEPGADLAAWIAAAPRPVLATVRSAAQGGAFRGTPAQAAHVLSAAAAAGARWLDVEEGVAAALAPLPSGVRLVRSRHLERFAAPAADASGELVKLEGAVRKVAGALDDDAALEAFRAALAAPVPAGGRAYLPVGALGALRVLDPQAALLYGSAGAPVVAGQPALLELLDELRAGEVTCRARLYGLVGEPPARSPSPALHNAAFRHHDLDALHVPLPGLSLEAALAFSFAGYSVTAPHKEHALAAAAEADEAARASGAANTLLRRREGGWRALNTDVTGIEASLPAAVGGERGVVHGAGGYARAALVALRRRGFATALVARDEARGRALAERFGAAWGGTSYDRQPADRVLLNATPAGADGGRVAALDADLRGLTVLDGPYAQVGRETWLAATARERGAVLVDGLALLLAQAMAQAEAFCNAPVPREVLALALRPRGNLVLVGLRGAGKTTVGRLVARRLGRPFVDLDEEVERATGRTPAEWIGRFGEASFREEEAAALAQLAGRTGLVIAAGGGAVVRPGHVERLRALGRVVWLQVAPSQAAARIEADDRPRPSLRPQAAGGQGQSAGQVLRAELDWLLRTRRAHYAAAAHETLAASGPAPAVADELARRWLTFALGADRSKEGDGRSLPEG